MNEFIIKNGFRSQGNSEVTGSLNVTGGITGSLQGTAAYAESASYATTALQALGIANAVTNNSNNRVLTATGGTDIYAETNLTFDSTVLTLTNGILTFTGSGAGIGRIQQSPGGAANGSYSHAQGLAVSANGAYSHAEGSSTNASGFGSHAEGSGSATFTSKLYGAKNNTITSGVFQLTGDVTAEFAPGNRLYYNSATYPDNTSFVVDTSVFGGVNTTITLTNSGITDSNFVVGSLDYAYTSWGGNSLSSADGGHAEGYYTNAVADWSHAEGYQTQTFARYSHAEGGTTQANGTYSHAEGRDAKTFGQSSHAEGEGTQAKGDGSHAEGYLTISSGSYSHAEGRTTTANGIYSHAEGMESTAAGYASHAEGINTTATGLGSHAEGAGTAYGNYSHAEGVSTTTGNASGYYAEMTASGVFTISSSYGDLSTSGLFDAGYIIGVDDSQYDNNYEYANLIVTSCSFNGANTIVHVTDTSFLTSTASIGSISNFGNGGDRAWGGYAAHAQGDATTAQGAYSHAEGKNTGAYGVSSHAEGAGTAYGNYSHAEGASTAYGEYSHAEGQSNVYGNYSHAEGESSVAGYNGYRMNTDITAGVIELEPIYGDQTANFYGGSFVLIFDNSGDIDTVNNSSNTYLYEVSSSAFTSSLTQITLVDNAVTTFSNFNRVLIGVYGNAQPTAADVPLGNASHAEGVSSRTIGEYSHTAGNLTQALGWYQSVVGMSNKPISTLGAFIVGDGDTTGNTRHNLLVAAAGSVTISGSLLMSGSILPATSGSVTSSFSLGSATNAWKDIWVSNGSIYMLDSTGSIQTTIESTPTGLAITGSLYGTVSSIIKGEATINFGAAPGSNYATTTISTPFVTNNSNIHIYIMSTASADHNAMEHQIFSLYGTVMPDNIINNTSFDIVALSQLRLDGTFKVRYTINNN